VIAYFWKQWRRTYFRDAQTFQAIVAQLFVASVVTAVIGYGLIKVIEKFVLHGKHAEVEQLFGRLDLIAPALAAVGILILIAGLRHSREQAASRAIRTDDRGYGLTGLNMNQAGWIGGIQGLCLPFRGFSRSGATISTGMLLGVAKARAEEFSFALAVILTPPAIAREVWRLLKAQHLAGAAPIASAMMPSLLGMVFAFLAGLLALKWLSQWLESGRWYWFGIYCLIAAVVVEYLHHVGY
jgi:undecaprenyl-diphosphatase